MGESRNKGAGGSSGELSGRVPVSTFTGLQADINRVALLGIDEIRALVSKVLDTPGPLDLRPFTLLKPSQVAELVKHPEWQSLINAMKGMAVINPDDRYTRSQWRALAFFARTADAPKAAKGRLLQALDDAEAIDVEGMD